MPRVFFTAAARADVIDAMRWYDARAPAVVPRLAEALRTVVRCIAENPKQFPASSHATRRAMLKRFPLLVIFREAQDAVFIVAVFHTSRDPRTWQERSSRQ